MSLHFLPSPSNLEILNENVPFRCDKFLRRFHISFKRRRQQRMIVVWKSQLVETRLVWARDRFIPSFIRLLVNQRGVKYECSFPFITYRMRSLLSAVSQFLKAGTFRKVLERGHFGRGQRKKKPLILNRDIHWNIPLKRMQPINL